MKNKKNKKPLTQLEIDILNAYAMGMSYGHYKADQLTLAEKKKKESKKKAKRERKEK